MKALMYLGPKEMKVQQVPDVTPGQGEVKINVTYTGICGSDLHGYLGTTGRRTAPMVMGHEFAGVVGEVGPGVTKVKVGDHVTVQPILYCGHCDYCKKGLVNICADRKFLGTMTTNGSFVESLVIDQNNVLLLPEGVSDQAGAMIEPLAVAYSAVKMAGDIKGKTVMVIGAGTIGLLVIMVAKYFGAGAIIATDLSDHRLAMAGEHGAAYAFNPGSQDLDTELKAIGLRDSVDITIECVGATPTVQQSVNFLRNKGTAVWVGNSAQMVTVNMQEIVTRELTVKGTYIYTEKDFISAMELLGKGGIPVEKLIDKVVDLEGATAAFDQLLDGKSNLIKVLVESK